MSIHIFRYFLLKLFHEKRSFWSGADDAHIACENVPNLWQFVEASSAHEAAEFGDAGIVFASEDRTGIFFSVDAHGAEFVDFEGFFFQAGANLTVENRAGIEEFDRDGCDEEQRPDA